MARPPPKKTADEAAFRERLGGQLRQAATCTVAVRWKSPELPLPEAQSPTAVGAEAAAPRPPQTSPARAPEPAAGKRPVRVWTPDESRFGLRTLLRRRLTLTGVKPKVVAQHEYANSYLYGAVAPLTGESFFLELPALNRELFELFLAHLSEGCA